MKMKKCIGVMFITLVTAAVLLFGSNLNSRSPKSVLRVGIHTFPTTLNPVYATSETSQAIINKVFDSLFYYDCRGNITPGLVRDFNLDEKDMEIAVHLKQNIYFSDGKELEAGDVTRTVNLLLDRAFGYPYSSDLRFIKKIVTVDRYCFKIKLNGKCAAWKNRLTFKILNSRELERAEPGTFPGQKLSGTGPYMIKTVENPTKIILERSPAAPVSRGKNNNPGAYHRGDRSNHKNMYRFIEYIVVSYTHLMPLKLLNNEIDIGELQPEHAAAYRGIPQWQKRFHVLEYKKFGYTYLVFNTRNSAVTKDLGEFLYRLLIEGDFLDRFLVNRGERVRTPFLLLDSRIGSIPPGTTKPTPLEKPVRLKILTNSESKLRKEFVLFLRQELKPYKIHLEPVLLEYQSFLEYLKKGRFDAAVSGYMLDIDYDMKDIFGSGSFFNYAGFHCPEMDTLLNRGLTEMDPGKREEIYMNAHRVWRQELPLIPLFNLYYYMGVSRKIGIPAETCTLVGAVGDFLLNIHDWKTPKRNENQ